MCGGGGILGAVGLGGNSTTGQSQTGQTQSTSTVSQPAQNAYNQALGSATNLAQQPVQAYTGPTSAAMNGLQAAGAQQTADTPTGLGGFQSQVQGYMSPYITNALQAQQNENDRNYAIQGQQLQGQATQAGAFGGDRQALQQSENTRNQLMSDNSIWSNGLNTAYTNATNQYNQGVAQQLQQANQLGTMGNQQQNTQQQGVQLGYNEFLRQQNYPYMQDQFLANMATADPTRTSSGTSSGDTSTSGTSSPLSQLMGLGGLGMAGYGILNNGLKKGGSVKRYAEGGAVGSDVSPDQLAGLTDQQLQQVAQLHPELVQVIQQIMAQRAQERMATGLGAQEAEMHFAGGGIASVPGFSGADDSQVPDPRTLRDRAALDDGWDRTIAATQDLVTLPGRGLAGAFETGVTRPLNALGLNLPYLPDAVYGGNAASPTPYYDKIRQMDRFAAGNAPKQPAPAAAPAATPAQPGAANLPDVGDANRALGDMAASMRVPTLTLTPEQQLRYVKADTDYLNAQTATPLAAYQARIQQNADAEQAALDRLIAERKERHGKTDASQQELLNEQKEAARKARYATMVQMGLGMLSGYGSGFGSEGRQFAGAMQGYTQGHTAQQAAQDAYRKAQMAFNQHQDEDADKLGEMGLAGLQSRNKAYLDSDRAGFDTISGNVRAGLTAGTQAADANVRAQSSSQSARALTAGMSQRINVARMAAANANKEIDRITKEWMASPEYKMGHPMPPNIKQQIDAHKQRLNEALQYATTGGGLSIPTGTAPSAAAGFALVP